MEDLRAPGLNFGMASHWSHPNLEQGFSAGSGDIWQCVETFLVVTNWVGIATGIWSVEASCCFFFLLLFSHSVVSNSLQPHGLQHTRLPCPSLSPGVCSNSYPLSWWCHPAILSSIFPFSCLQSFPASGSFLMSRLFASGGQSIGASASALVLPMNIQDWFCLGWTGWISLQSKGLSRVFSNTTVQKHQFFGTQLSL